MIAFLKTTDDLLLEAGCMKMDRTKTSEYQFEYQWIPSGRLIGKGACVDSNYKPYFVPETGITRVYSTIEQQVIRNVDAKEETVSIDFTLVMRWQDPNIRTNFTHQDKTIGAITLDEKNAFMIWIPDFYIFDLRSFKLHEERTKSLKILTEEHFFQFKNISTSRKQRRKTTVELRIEVKTTVYCQFNHGNYPIDTQKCRVKLGSRSLGAIFKLYDPTKTFHQITKYEAASFDISITFFDGGLDDGMNTIGLDITMDRIYEPFIWKYYVPCTAIVLVSGLSFTIPLSAIPGRVALLVTQFLSLINLFIFQMVSLYRVF